MGSPNCGMTVRRITNVEEKEKDHTGEDATKDMSRAGVPMAARKRKSSFKNDEVVAQFRRVRILYKLQPAAMRTTFVHVDAVRIHYLSEKQPHSLQQQQEKFINWACSYCHGINPMIEEYCKFCAHQRDGSFTELAESVHINRSTLPSIFYQRV